MVSDEVTTEDLPRIFVSHAAEDGDFAGKVAADLRSASFDVWIDYRDAGPGNFVERINDGLTRDVLLLILSPAAIASKWVQQEMGAAIVRSNNGWMREPIVIQVCKCDESHIPPLWMVYHRLDGMKLDYKRVLSTVINQLRAHPAAKQPLVAVPVGLPRPASLIGRDSELNRLKAKLSEGDSIGVYALNGMGGVGKTAVAAEVVAQLSQRHDLFPGGAIWVPCEGLEGASGLNELFARVTQRFGDRGNALPRTAGGPMQLGRYLAMWPRLLIALDNVEPALDADTVLNALAIPNHTVVLLTSRQSVAPHRLAAIGLSTLSHPAAASLLLRRLAQADSNRASYADPAHAEGIVTLVGGLPLAIELIAAYAGVQRLSLVEIAREFELDKLQAPSLTFDPSRAVATRFERSWRLLPARLQRVFAALSLITTSTFPRAIAVAAAAATLHHGVHEPKGSYIGWDVQSQRQVQVKRLQAQRDIAKLVSLSLVEAHSDGNLRLHPLLREYGAERLSEVPHSTLRTLRVALMNAWDDYSPNPERIDQELKKRKVDVEHGYSVTLPALHLEKDWRTHLIASTWIGALYSRQQRETDLAFERVAECLIMFEMWGNQEMVGRCYQLMGWLHEDAGDRHRAIEAYRAALECFDAEKSDRATAVTADLQRLGESDIRA